MIGYVLLILSKVSNALAVKVKKFVQKFHLCVIQVKVITKINWMEEDEPLKDQ